MWEDKDYLQEKLKISHGSRKGCKTTHLYGQLMGPTIRNEQQTCLAWVGSYSAPRKASA